MHTLFQLRRTMFDLHIAGEKQEVETLFQWTSHDRLGVVMAEPFGALGCSLAIQLAITNYFDFGDGGRRARPHYADIYLFHVGGRWGDFSLYDFWPSRREIFVADDPHAVLAAVNDHGITHLLVPNGAPTDVLYNFKEAEAAIERLKFCMAYAADGIVVDADVALGSGDPVTLENMRGSMWPQTILETPVAPALYDDPPRLADHLRWRATVRARLHEVPALQRNAAEARARLLLAAGTFTETYRRVSPQWAIQRLAPASHGDGR
jgi:hypothetical protein